MIASNAADERRSVRDGPGVFGENAAEKLFAAGFAQPREVGSIPGKKFVRLSLDPTGVATEDETMIAGECAPDNAAAGSVRRDVELVQRRRLRRPRSIHRA